MKPHMESCRLSFVLKKHLSFSVGCIFCQFSYSLLVVKKSLFGLACSLLFYVSRQNPTDEISNQWWFFSYLSSLTCSSLLCFYVIFGSFNPNVVKISNNREKNESRSVLRIHFHCPWSTISFFLFYYHKSKRKKYRMLKIWKCEQI